MEIYKFVLQSAEKKNSYRIFPRDWVYFESELPFNVSVVTTFTKQTPTSQGKLQEIPLLHNWYPIIVLQQHPVV